jgi:hypothetical protein
MHNDLSRELVMAAFDCARAIQKRVWSSIQTEDASNDFVNLLKAFKVI